MSKFNEELKNADVLLALDGLHPSQKGARITFSRRQADRAGRTLHRGQGTHRRQINRAVAVAMAFGPTAGLELIDRLTFEPSLRSYHLLPSVRGDFLAKLGRIEEASAEFQHAASLTKNARERGFLLKGAAACTRGTALA